MNDNTRSELRLAPASRVSPENAESKAPLSEQAYQIIRGRILRGVTAAGEKLKIDDLQRDLEISSSPLREALNRLAAENLVIADERRGFRAAPVTIADLMDLTAMRCVVEPGALAASMKSGSDAWESQVVAAFYRLDRVEHRITAGCLNVAAQGHLDVLIDRVMPLAEAAAAHRLVGERAGIGKIVLTPW